MGNEASSSGGGGGNFGSSTSSSVGGGPKQRPAHEISSQAGLTELYNSKVVSVETFVRPVGSSNNSGGIFLPHTGVVVTTDKGDRHLVHKGDGYGYKGGNTVVTSAKTMSPAWTSLGGPIPVEQKMTVADAVKAGGENYKLSTDNCIHATKNILGQALKK